MTLPRRNWMDMTWQDVAGAASATVRWIAVLPLAAVEQHGPHLPLGVDTYIAEAYLARVQ
ncbi:MAG: creatininase family protein, partial [Xanthobacteraceae bacterium]